MARFVLLYHDCPPGHERRSHWDFMLEYGSALRTWALQTLPDGWQETGNPSVGQSNSMQAEQLADHRLAYLDYEGPVSGDRGSVTRADAGMYETIVESTDAWELILAGQRIRGRVVLRREVPGSSRWTLTSAPDR